MPIRHFRILHFYQIIAIHELHAGAWYTGAMQTALRAGGLLIIAGAVAGLVLIFATDPAEAPEALNESMALSFISPAFEHEGTVPSRFTCDGDNVSPPLAITGVPEGTQALAIVMDDPDVPKQLRPDGVFDHWVLFNIAPSTGSIEEGASAGVRGANGRGDAKYTGPCPPTQYEPAEHRYFFKLYALDTMLDLPEGSSKQEVLAAMQGHVLEETTLMGRYKRTAQ